MKFEEYSQPKVRTIDHFLETNLKHFRGCVSQRFGPIVDAMQYSLEGGGKRLRPLLVLASAECVGLEAEKVLPAACAMEYIHTYSLVHDDLPAIDDDDFRRGKPSSHRKFGEAIAILAGDALLTEAFGLISQLQTHSGVASENVISALELLVHAAGVRGMVGGQFLDVTTDHPTYSLPEVEFIHIHKTGALILGSVLLPTRLTNVPDPLKRKLRHYGEAIGLAFQISDDLLDAESTLRYSRGPRKKPKPSYSQLMSHTEMKQKMNSLIDSAVEALESESKAAQGLVAIAEFIRDRKK